MCVILSRVKFCIFLILSFTNKSTAHSRYKTKPHIIFVLADDLGWNDVGFHGSNEIPTPNIDALAYTGVILNNYYVSPLCTPTRGALMTGKYPIHLGLQHSVIRGSTPYGLSTDEIILPQFLKMNGYVTKAVGKWHLGHFKKEYTPELRGFDTHFGYWLGRSDYYDHNYLEENMYWGYDLKRGLNTSRSEYGSYSTDIFTTEAVKIIKEHNDSKPLFLYLAHQAVHSGNEYSPLQPPPEGLTKFSYIKDISRRKFAGTLSKLDDSLGEIVSALSEKGMIENSIIIFSTDNGGPASGFDGNAASNWPLRGVKSTLWQGGVKGVGLIWSPLLPSGTVSDALIHVADWLPTILHVVQGNVNLSQIDGVSLWDSLVEKKDSPRTNVLLNIDPKIGYSGLIHKNWKLLKGNSKKGEKWDKWFGPSGRGGFYDWAGLRRCKTAKSLQSITPLPPKSVIEMLRRRSTISCNSVFEKKNKTPTDVFLFNLKNDPCETNNLASLYPVTLKKLNTILTMYNQTMVRPSNQPSDPRSEPRLWNYEWINWMDHLDQLNEYEREYNYLSLISLIIGIYKGYFWECGKGFIKALIHNKVKQEKKAHT